MITSSILRNIIKNTAFDKFHAPIEEFHPLASGNILNTDISILYMDRHINREYGFVLIFPEGFRLTIDTTYRNANEAIRITIHSNTGQISTVVYYTSVVSCYILLNGATQEQADEAILKLIMRYS